MFKEFIHEGVVSDKARNDYAMLQNYLRIHINDVKLTLDLTTHECYTDEVTIFIGYKVTEFHHISILDALLHEVYHNILPKPKEYERYTVKQVNLCEDLEINSKLGLDAPEMEVAHPSKMGLTVGLKTIEYLRLLFPEQEKSPESGEVEEPQFGDQFLDKAKGCSHVESDEMYKVTESLIEERMVKKSLDFKPKPLKDSAIISFLQEAKNKSETYLLSKQISKTYTKFSRRSHDPRIITPGTREVGGEPFQMGKTPVLLLDSSTSMNNQIPLAESIMGYVRAEFCIMLYSDKPGWKFYPGDKNISFIPLGGTSIYKSVQQIIREDKDSVGDFYVITDGDDDSLPKAASYIRSLDREFHVLKISEDRAPRRLSI